MKGLQNNKRIKEFVAFVQDDQDENSNIDGHESIEDLVAHLIDIASAQKNNEYQDPQHRDQYHEPSYSCYNRLSNSAVIN